MSVQQFDMNEFFIYAFLAAAGAWYGRFAAGVAKEYDCSAPVWPGIRGWRVKALRAKHGNEGAKAVIVANCYSLSRISTFAAGLFAVAGIWQAIS